MIVTPPDRPETPIKTVKFTFNGVESAVDLPVNLEGTAISTHAGVIASWPVGTRSHTHSADGQNWTITAQGETVTAEVVA